MTKIQNLGWYQQLIDDLSGILTEGIFSYRWTLIETYYSFGNRILEDYSKFENIGKSEKEIRLFVVRSLVTKDVKVSDRTIRRAVQFAKYVKKELEGDINKLPEGKNISWHKIVNKLLPEDKKECVHEPETITRCKKCRKLL